MIYFIFIFATLLSTSAFSATKVYVAVSNPASLETFMIDDSSSKLIHQHSLKIPETPMTIAPSHDNIKLYLGLRDKGGQGRLLTLSLNHHPELIHEAKLPFQVRYMSPDNTGRHVLFADYFGGQVGVLRIINGRLTSEVCSIIETEKFAHCVKLSLDQQYAYAPHTEPNMIYQFKYNSSKGEIVQLDTALGPQNIENNRAPRHITKHPTSPFYYTSNEHKGGISFWSQNKQGHLMLQQSLSTLPYDFEGSSTAADIQISPNGKFVYVSNRGGKNANSKVGINTIAGFAIDPSTGTLSSIGHFSSSKRPRSFSISKNGNHLITSGQSDKKVALFRIDSLNGTLKQIHEVSVPGKANWVICLP